MSDMEYNWADCPMCDEKDKRIEELEAENRRLFAAHSVEMLRADKLKQEVKRLRKEKDDE